MVFKKNHPHRMLPSGEVALDKEAIAFKGRVGQKEKLKLIPNWQERMRDFVDELIQELTINDKT
ncbi:MAG: hypothetical protein SAK29_12135 [Scytonema sp. PMC 1069.18]|nr:hypothetical protein [Scytonema sp. PMC 1069.18]